MKVIIFIILAGTAAMLVNHGCTDTVVREKQGQTTDRDFEILRCHDRASGYKLGHGVFGL